MEIEIVKDKINSTAVSIVKKSKDIVFAFSKSVFVKSFKIGKKMNIRIVVEVDKFKNKEGEIEC